VADGPHRMVEAHAAEHERTALAQGGAWFEAMQVVPVADSQPRADGGRGGVVGRL
jgi:hypothetical protein